MAKAGIVQRIQTNSTRSNFTNCPVTSSLTFTSFIHPAENLYTQVRFAKRLLYHLLFMYIAEPPADEGGLLDKRVQDSIFMTTVLLWFIVEEFMSVLVWLGFDVFNVFGSTGRDHIVSKNGGTRMHDIEFLNELEIRNISILPVIDEEGVHLANMVRMFLEEGLNGGIKASMNNLMKERRSVPCHIPSCSHFAPYILTSTVSCKPACSMILRETSTDCSSISKL